MSVTKASNGETFWPPLFGQSEFRRLLDRIDGVAAGIRNPTTLAFELCACSRNEEKSDVLSGCLTPPSTLPPAFTTTLVVSFSRSWPKA